MKNKYIKDKLKPYILLIPVLVIIIGILGFGVINCLLQSLGYIPSIGLKQITAKYYKEVFMSKDFLQSLRFSIYTSLISSLIAIILGVFIAYGLAINEKRKNIINIMYKFPIIVPHTVAALLIFNVISQGGIISRIFYEFGIISDMSKFPLLILDKNGIGIMITYIWKEVPFVAMTVYGIMSNINMKLFKVALNLGANRKKAFFNIIIPLSMPAIISSFLIIFAFSFGAFEIPYLLGPTTPKALPVKAYIEYTAADLNNRPYAMVINMTLIFIAALLIFLYEKSYSLLLRRQDKE